MDEPVPEGVDYNMWLGPAPTRPFNTNHFHGSWRHFWNYGGGMFSDWGVHLIDMLVDCIHLLIHISIDCFHLLIHILLYL